MDPHELFKSADYDNALKQALHCVQHVDKHEHLIGEIYEFSLSHFNLKAALKWYSLAFFHGHDTSMSLQSIERVLRKLKRRKLMNLDVC